MIIQHAGTRLLAETTAGGVSLVSSAVATKIPYDPAPYLSETQFKFPMLAVYRKSSTMVNDHTASWMHDESEVDCAYILPPLTPGQLERVYPILHAVGQILMERTRQGHDPSYLSDALVWSKNFAGIESIGFTKYSFGSYPSMGNLVFPAWIGTFLVKEQTKQGTFQSLAGIDVTENIV